MVGIWFSEDIRRALVAADESSAAMAEVAEWLGHADPVEVRAYREGYRDALITLALAFGLAPAVVSGGLALLEIGDR